MEHVTLMFEVAVRLLLAMCIGGGIGWERARAHHPAGIRTHMLVTIGAAVVMLLGSQTVGEFAGTANSDPARLGAQVISGIGFLGAGTIMKEGRSVRGLTTARDVVGRRLSGAGDRRQTICGILWRISGRHAGAAGV